MNARRIRLGIIACFALTVGMFHRAAAFAADPSAGCWSALFELPADGRWHEFELPSSESGLYRPCPPPADDPCAQVGCWTLRARLEAFQTAALNLSIRDERGDELASETFAPGLLSGRIPGSVQYMPPSAYDSPFSLEIPVFEPGRRIRFRLAEDRVEYCRLPTSLADCYGDSSLSGPPPDALADPVLALDGGGRGSVFSWAGGRYELRRYYVSRNGVVSNAGYVIADRTKRVVTVLLEVEHPGATGPWARFFPARRALSARGGGRDGLLLLHGDEASPPLLFRLCATGAVRLDLPWKEMTGRTAPWGGKGPSPWRFEVVDCRHYPGADGGILSLALLAEGGPAGPRLARYHVGKGRVIACKVDLLSYRQAAIARSRTMSAARRSRLH